MKKKKGKEHNGFSSPTGPMDGSDVALRNHKDTVFRKLFSIKENAIKLSDYYMDMPPLNSLELVVKIIKIGYTNNNKNILEKSPILMGYAKLLEYISEYRLKDYQLTESIDLAIKDCINQGYIEDFLVK